MGLPRVQQNERPTLYLLALLNHTPGTVWVDVQNPLVGVTPIRVWAREHYDKKYAPNTRETDDAPVCEGPTGTSRGGHLDPRGRNEVGADRSKDVSLR